MVATKTMTPYSSCSVSKKYILYFGNLFDVCTVWAGNGEWFYILYNHDAMVILISSFLRFSDVLFQADRAAFIGHDGLRWQQWMEMMLSERLAFWCQVGDGQFWDHINILEFATWLHKLFTNKCGGIGIQSNGHKWDIIKHAVTIESLAISSLPKYPRKTPFLPNTWGICQDKRNECRICATFERDLYLVKYDLAFRVHFRNPECLPIRLIALKRENPGCSNFNFALINVEVSSCFKFFLENYPFQVIHTRRRKNWGKLQFVRRAGSHAFLSNGKNKCEIFFNRWELTQEVALWKREKTPSLTYRIVLFLYTY